MPVSLLHTKLFVPPLRPFLVRRPRLVEQLKQGQQLGCKLSLISAPAGYGKTTLVGEWLGDLRLTANPQSQFAHHVAWYSLDRDDNDLAQFLRYLVTAISQAGNGSATIGKTALAMLQSPQLPSITAVLTSVVNELAALPGQIILVLDDLHLINAQSIHDALTFLLDSSPPSLHIVIATREDPPLPLARFRARAQLTELRAADLRFTLSETADFLNHVMGLGLSTADVAALETRTEGWITGLQLAAISMRSSKDSAGFIASFTGSHRYVLDYLIEEVLAQQPEDVQAFLLQTVVLNRLSGPLCDALTGQTSGQATLEMLDQANLFVVPLDEERRWYRYHHLFADLLRRRLRHLQQEQVPTLHGRASRWYAENDFVNDAVAHALHAEQFERAAQLIESDADAIWRRGEHGRLMQWLAALSLDVVLARPPLCIFHAWYLFAGGQHDMAEQVLRAAEQSLSTSKNAFTSYEQSRLRGRIAAIHSFMASYRGDVPAIIQYARQALALLPEDDLTWRSSAAVMLGDAHGFAGDMTAAYEARLAAAQACQQAKDNYFLIIANLKLAITLRAQGKLQATIDMCQQQMALVTEQGLGSAPIVGWSLAVWGETLAERGELDEALALVQKGMALIERGVDLAMRGWSDLCLIRVLFSIGDFDAVEAVIHKFRKTAREADVPPWIDNQIHGWQVRLWLAQGELTLASQWMSERGLAVDDDKPLPPMDFFLLIDYITVARILLAQGRPAKAIPLLQHLHQAAVAGGRVSKLIEIELLQALAFDANGKQARALQALETAVTRAAPEGFVRVFADEGAPMVRLLEAGRDAEIAPDYVRKLLAAFPANESLETAVSPAQVDQSELVEPLSERELEVLEKIATGLTNREIADRLYLSLNTVKVHTRNIYGKLGVHNRTQAVARARLLGLLPTP